jgi:hypothetical protein
MGNEKLDQVLRTVDPEKRASLKKLVVGTAFAVPIIASYSVKDLAYGTVGSCPVTSTITVTKTGVVVTTVTQTTTVVPITTTL